MKTIILFKLFFLLFIGCSIGQNIIQAEYFIGHDPGAGNGTSFTISAGDTVNQGFELGLAGMEPGPYYLHIRVKDQNNQWSLYKSHFFYIYDPQSPIPVPESEAIIAAEYFFNTDPGPGNAIPFEFNILDSVDIQRTIDVTGLDTGMHHLYIRIMDYAGNWSLYKNTTFNVIQAGCPVPKVNFSSSVVQAGVPTIFTNLSTNINEATTYEWDINIDGVTDYTTKDISHTFLSNGVYDVKLTVNNGGICVCSVIHQVDVGTVPSTNVAISGSTSFCEGEIVELTASAGLHYRWSTGDTTNSIIVSMSGDYFVWVTSIDSIIVKSESIAITVYDKPEVHLFHFNSSDGLDNGAAYALISGGSGQYSYLWSTGSSESFINNLSPGQYSVTIDDGFCPYQATFTITNQLTQQGDIVATEYFFDSDPGVGNGIAITSYGGELINYSFQIPLSGLEPGSHYLHIRGRDSEMNWSIYKSHRFYIYDNSPVEPIPDSPPMMSAEYFIDTDPGAGNGTSVNITPGDDVDHQFILELSGLSAGFHYLHIRVKDESNQWSNYKAHKFYIIESQAPPALPESESIIAAEYFFNSDPGAGNGFAFEFNVQDSFNLHRTVNLTGLSIGTHHLYIRVMDYAGNWSLYKNLTFNIIQPDCMVPGAEFQSTIVNAGVATNFTNLSANVNDTTTYAWDIDMDGLTDYTTADFSHIFLSNGVYDVRLTVNNGNICSSSVIHQVYVGTVPSTTITIAGDTLICEGDHVLLTAAEGTHFKWSTGDTTQSIEVSDAGAYFVWVTSIDSIVVKSEIANISLFDKPNVNIYYYNSTDGLNNGSAYAVVSGGSGQYSYLWSTGETEYFINNLSPGNYSLNLDDGLCPVTVSFIISNLETVAGNIYKAEYFFDADPGAGAGTPINIYGADLIDYHFDLPLNGLSHGFHYLHIRIQDKELNWSIYKSHKIQIIDTNQTDEQSESPVLVAAEYFIDSDPGPGNGLPIEVFVNNEFNLQRTINLSGIPIGNHALFIRVKDADGNWGLYKRKDFTVLDVDSCTAPYAEYQSDTVGYGSFTNFTNLSSAITDTTTYAWDINVDGITDYTTADISHVFPAPGIYPVQLSVRNASNCVSSVIHQVIVGTVPSATISVNGPTHFCSGETRDLTASSSANYIWSTGDTTQNITVSESGAYYVFITSEDGITIMSDVVNMTKHENPVSVFTFFNSTNGLGNGAAAVTVSGGSGVYTYSWSNDSTTSYVNNLLPGQYSLIVNDGFCPVQHDFSITNEEIAESDIIAAEYFINHDPGVGNATALNIYSSELIDFNFSIPLSGLIEGFHYLYIRVKNNDSTWSLYKRHLFYVYEDSSPEPLQASPITNAEYYPDSDPGVGNGISIPVVPGSNQLNQALSFPTMGLGVGFHYLHIRIKDETNQWSLPMRRLFYILDSLPSQPLAESSPLTHAEYFIDIDPGYGNGIPVSIDTGNFVEAAFQITIPDIPLGTHQLFIRVRDLDGNWSFYKRAPFTVCTEYGPIARFDHIITQNTVTLVDQSSYAAEYLWTFGDGTTSTLSNPVHTYTTPGTYSLCQQVTNTCGTQIKCDTIGIIGVSDYSPHIAGNVGKVTIKFMGFGFNADTKVKLVNEGMEIEMDTIYYSSTSLMHVRFNLLNKPLGLYDIMVSIPGEPEIILEQSFTIEEGVLPQPWVSITGTPRALFGGTGNYSISVGNNGNVDAEGMILYVAFTNDTINLDVDLQFDVDRLPPNEFDLNFPYDSIPIYINTSIKQPVPIIQSPPAVAGNKSNYYGAMGYINTAVNSIQILGNDSTNKSGFYTIKPMRLYAFYLPLIKANSKELLSMKVRMFTPIEISTWIGGPTIRNEDTVQGGKSKESYLEDCLLSIAEEALETVLPGAGCITGAAHVLGEAAVRTSRYSLAWEWAKFVVGCGTDLIPVTKVGKAIWKGIEFAAKVEGVMSCWPPRIPQPPTNPPSIIPQLVNSMDPNDKYGYRNSMGSKYFKDQVNFDYEIHFENADSATAPAREVYIFDTLDTEVFDLETFSLGHFAFGDTLIHVPAGLKEYSTQIDLQPERNVIVRFNAKLNGNTGVVTWYFGSFDPVTMELTDDPFNGFLPPNVNDGEGKGYITYSVDLKDSLPHGTEIENFASIVFDYNQPILTPTWVNIIDLVPPVSTFHPLPEFVPDTFNISWEGIDADAGIAYYDVYLKVNESPFVKWISFIKDTTLTCIGMHDTIYSFYVIATDSAENIELKITVAEATTKVFSPFPPLFQNAEVCYGLPNPDLIALGDSVKWYNSPGLSVLLHSGNSFTSNETEPGTYRYYATQMFGEVESEPSEVLLTIFPIPFISLTDTISVCEGDTAWLDAGNYFAYSWSTGDSNQIIPVVLAGNYIVTISDTNLCQNSDSIHVQIISEPVAGFTSVIDQHEVGFTNTSSYSSTYFWYFGDGQTSDEQDPVHLYGSSGTFIVTLIAFNQQCSDTISFSVTTYLNFSINATINIMNSGTVSGTGIYMDGDTVEITATPNTGYYFVNWTVNGTAVSTDPVYSFVVTKDSSFVANFALQSFTISATVDPLNSGSIAGTGIYMYGDTAEITATPNTGHLFVNWTVNGTEVSADPVYSFVVTQDSSFVANFVLQSFTISASVDPLNSGSITGTGIYMYGDTAEITATPNIGYFFVNWTVNGTEVSADPVYSFVVTEDSSFVANFALQSFTISATVDPLNSGSITGTGIYMYGENAELTASSASGFQFINWTENGNVVYTDSAYSFVVIQDRILMANFENITGTEQLIDENSIIIYPNPADDVLYITNAPQKSIISVFDMNGRKIFENEISDNQLNIKKLGSGIYLIMIIDNTQVFISKFTKL